MGAVPMVFGRRGGVGEAGKICVGGSLNIY